MQLKVKISKRLAAKEQMQRRKNLTKYIPNAVAAVFPVLDSMSQNDAVGSKRRLLQVIHGLTDLRHREIRWRLL